MALTFSYQLVQASTAEVAGTALNDQSVKVSNNGTTFDQSRLYYLDLYVKDATDTNNTLEALDFTATFANDLFEDVSAANITYAAPLDLMRSSVQDASSIRMTEASAESIKKNSTDGLTLSTTEQFVGRIQLDVNDDAWASESTISSSFANFVTLTVDQNETIVVTSNGRGAGRNQIESLAEYGGYSVDASSPDVEIVTGAFQSDVTEAFSGFGTELVTSTGTVAGEALTGALRTNLVREGQQVSGSFVVSNVGDAGLTGVAMQAAETTNIALTGYDSLSVSTTFDQNIDAAANGGFGGVVSNAGVAWTTQNLERATRNSATGELNTGDTSDRIEVSYSAEVSGAAGTVAIFDAGNLTFTANGEDTFSAFAGGIGTNKNLITYASDVNYDGTVGMRDLATLNEGARVAAAGGEVAADVDVNHDGQIDISDLVQMQDQWGSSIWNGDGTFDGEGDGDTQITDAQLVQQNNGVSTQEDWVNTPFTTEGGLAQAAGYQTALTTDLELGADSADSTTYYTVTSGSAV